ncbi:MAG: selenocysteine-specific translation elongation factor [Symbiobacteriia bacterium]
MKHLIIGTAGHVDHGKTALIRALTGQETDRLPEEKARGISIDLGFAHFRLPSGRRAAIIDVPGHERFIKNMLAGATGVDLVLLVVAADEGVMPQTVEHLDILRLLDVHKGLIALTKVDLVDADWRLLVEEDVHQAVAGTFLEHAPIVCVSAVTGEGLPELTHLLDDLLQETDARNAAGLARLPIDRVFTRPGFGTVVTGTLVSGRIAVEDRLEVLPQGLTVRVRGLQVHGEKMDQAEAGQRVAVNLTGVEKEDLARGNVLASPGVLRPTQSLAGSFVLLESWGRPFATGSRVHLHTGTAEVLARVNLLDRDELEPGQSTYVQLRTEEPVVVDRGDRFILRSYSPMHTLGGGLVVDPHGRYKRGQSGVTAELEAKAQGGTLDLALQAMVKAGLAPVSVADLARLLSWPESQAVGALQELAGQGEVVPAGGGAATVGAPPAAPGGEAGEAGEMRYWHPSVYRDLQGQVKGQLQAFYRSNPLRWGTPKEELRRRLMPKAEARVWSLALARLQADGIVAADRDRVALAGHIVELSPVQQATAAAIEGRFAQAGFAPPAPREALEGLPLKGAAAEEVLQHLLDQQVLVKVAEDLLFHRGSLDQARQRVTDYFASHERLGMGDFRDLLGTTRKYAVPLLEYFDQMHLTRRQGDDRVRV